MTYKWVQVANDPFTRSLRVLLSRKNLKSAIVFFIPGVGSLLQNNITSFASQPAIDYIPFIKFLYRYLSKAVQTSFPSTS